MINIKVKKDKNNNQEFATETKVEGLGRDIKEEAVVVLNALIKTLAEPLDLDKGDILAYLVANVCAIWEVEENE